MKSGFMSMFRAVVDRVRPAHIFCFFFVFYALMNLLKMPPYILLEDESFYFFQAKAMLQGQLIFFDRTNPYLFPFTLSFFSTAPLVLLRMVPVLFMALAMSVYFHILKKNTDNLVAFFAVCLLAFHVRIIEYSMLLYTEGLLLLLLFLCMDKLLDILQGRTAWKDFILLGIFMGLSLQTKPLIPLVPVFFIVWVLWRTKGEYKIKALAAGMISLLIYLPYYLMNGLIYFTHKFHPVSSLQMILERFSFAVDHCGVVFLLILAIALLRFWRDHSGERRDVYKVFFSFSAVYLFFIVFIIVFSLPRYFLLCLPLAVLLIARYVLYEKLKENERAPIVVIYFVLFLVVSLVDLHRVPAYYRDSSHVLPGYRGRYIELKDVHQTYLFKDVFLRPDWRPDMAHVTVLNGQRGGVRRELPVFDQGNNTVAEYTFDFNVAESSFRYLYLSRVCDKVKVILDGKALTGDWAVDLFVLFQINLARPLEAGTHRLTLLIFNDDNVGGIGQVLLTEDDLSRTLGLASIVMNEEDVTGGAERKELTFGENKG